MTLNSIVLIILKVSKILVFLAFYDFIKLTESFVHKTHYI